MAVLHDVHHQAPRCLPRLFDLAAEGLADWSEFEGEAARWSADPRVGRGDLTALVEGSTCELPVAEHRGLHQDAGDFARWELRWRGGLRTLARYGRPYFLLLALEDLRQVRDHARAGYLAAARDPP